jgi:hypothetical protein
MSPDQRGSEDIVTVADDVDSTTPRARYRSPPDTDRLNRTTQQARRGRRPRAARLRARAWSRAQPRRHRGQRNAGAPHGDRRRERHARGAHRRVPSLTSKKALLTRGFHFLRVVRVERRGTNLVPIFRSTPGPGAISRRRSPPCACKQSKQVPSREAARTHASGDADRLRLWRVRGAAGWRRLVRLRSSSCP